MYRSSSPGQLSFEDFYLPFGGKLSEDNRWVKLSQLIPWETIEVGYAEQFADGIGAPGLSVRIAFGALIIKEKLGLSDQETVEQVRENPYLQYFLGLSEYSNKAPFEASSLVHFRKRLSPELLAQANEAMIEQAQANLNSQDSSVEAKDENTGDDEHDDDGDAPATKSNRGKLVFDATCAPADIRYPTDLNLINHAREKSEKILDQLYGPLKEQYPRKPRTYRIQARKDYLKVAKQKRPRRKTMRKAVGKQLRYLRRNLNHIDTLINDGACLSCLTHRQYRDLLVIHELYRQQWYMYENHVHRIEARIVSLSQPHVRPIVRGKAGTSVEFGAKLAMSYVAGFLRLERLSWDSFNESVDLIEQVEAYKQRTGYYPESVHADTLYRTADNRRWCREHGIRLTGAALGRPSTQSSSETKKQIKADAGYRNRIEGKFGQGKRRFSLGRVMTKLAETSATAISVTIFVINLELLLWQLICALFWSLECLNDSLRKKLEPLRRSLMTQEVQMGECNFLLLSKLPFTGVA